MASFENRLNFLNSKLSIETANTPSEVREALRDIRERTRMVQEINRRRLAKYGRKIRKR